MKQPPLRISIVILVYNVAPYLVECLDSVRAQTYPDWEALCVDDGSTDASSILLDTYARLDPRIHVIHQRNAGVSSARNRALDTAHGEWICFVDGDDAIHPQALERLARALGKAPSVQAVVFERLSGEVLPRQWNLEDAAPQVERQHSEAMLRRFEPSVWRVLFRRDCIGALRFPAYVIGEDGLFSLQYYLRTSMWLVVEWSLYFYRARQSSVMHTEPSVRFVRDWLDCFYERVCLFARDYVISDGGGGVTYLEDIRARAWFTRGGMLFALPSAIGREVLPLWLRLVQTINAVHPYPLHRRLRLYFIAESRSFLLARWLILGPYRVWSALCALCPPLRSMIRALRNH